MIAALCRLCAWLALDEDWQHGYGVYIETSDNPGWLVRFYLDDTPFDTLSLERERIDRSEKDWLDVSIRDDEKGHFLQVAGGPLNLEEAIGVVIRLLPMPPE